MTSHKIYYGDGKKSRQRKKTRISPIKNKLYKTIRLPIKDKRRKTVRKLTYKGGGWDLWNKATTKFISKFNKTIPIQATPIKSHKSDSQLLSSDPSSRSSEISTLTNANLQIPDFASVWLFAAAGIIFAVLLQP